jgi:FkbM family methyltransferase
MPWKRQLAKVPLAANLYARLRGIKSMQLPLIIEHMEVDLVFSRLTAKQTLRIWDIGAHHGEFLDIFERHNDEHAYDVICVEPMAENLAVLRSKQRYYRRVQATICPVAISDVSSSKTFYAGAASTLFTCTPEWLTEFPEYFKQPRQVTVDCLTIGEVMRRYHINDGLAWDFIKVDTEGHDLNVIRSMIAAQVYPCAVMCEIGPDLHQTVAAIDLLRAHRYGEFYIFGRSGLATMFIGEYVDPAQLTSLRDEGRLSAGNFVGFRSASDNE